MRYPAITIVAIACLAAPAAAVDFLGAELCAGSVETSVVLPVGSPLSLESAEIGRHGGLLMLLKSSNGHILDHIDDLMEPYVGVKGSGDEKKLQWSGNKITAYAQVIKKGYAALAVSTDDDCSAAEETPETTPTEPTVATVSEPEPQAGPMADTKEPLVAAAPAVTAAPQAIPEPAAEITTPDFELQGDLKHSPAEDQWVDVMGVVVNGSGLSFDVTSFDLSLYDADGALICVDTVSINHLRNGQERAFRSSIHCPDYAADAVSNWKLQFAGGH
jgi:hypothetical protein